jgi:hypothetical protein
MGHRGRLQAIEKRKFSLAQNQTPIPLSTSHSLCYYSQPVSSHYIKASKKKKNGSFKDYKILYDNNTIFSFIPITSANTTRKWQERKTSSQTAVEITISRSKKG